MRKILLILMTVLSFTLVGCSNGYNEDLNYADFDTIVLDNFEEVENIIFNNENRTIYIYVYDNSQESYGYMPYVLGYLDKKDVLSFKNPVIYLVNLNDASELKDVYEFEKAPALLEFNGLELVKTTIGGEKAYQAIKNIKTLK